MLFLVIPGLLKKLLKQSFSKPEAKDLILGDPVFKTWQGISLLGDLKLLFSDSGGIRKGFQPFILFMRGDPKRISKGSQIQNKSVGEDLERISTLE